MGQEWERTLKTQCMTDQKEAENLTSCTGDLTNGGTLSRITDSFFTAAPGNTCCYSNLVDSNQDSY